MEGDEAGWAKVTGRGGSGGESGTMWGESVKSFDSEDKMLIQDREVERNLEFQFKDGCAMRRVV